MSPASARRPAVTCQTSPWRCSSPGSAGAAPRRSSAAWPPHAAPPRSWPRRQPRQWMSRCRAPAGPGLHKRAGSAQPGTNPRIKVQQSCSRGAGARSPSGQNRHARGGALRGWQPLTPHPPVDCPVQGRRAGQQVRAHLLLCDFWVVDARHAVKERCAVARHEAQQDARAWIRQCGSALHARG